MRKYNIYSLDRYELLNEYKYKMPSPNSDPRHQGLFSINHFYYHSNSNVVPSISDTYLIKENNATKSMHPLRFELVQIN